MQVGRIQFYHPRDLQEILALVLKKEVKQYPASCSALSDRCFSKFGAFWGRLFAALQ